MKPKARPEVRSLLLLHGALGDRTQLSPLALLLGAGGWELALARTAALTTALAHGDVAVVPGTPHPFERVWVPLVAALTRDFLDLALSTPTPKPA